MRNTRPINWIKAARKDFDDFPEGAQLEMARALTILAEGQMPDIAKPLTGFGSGVMELALKHRGDAFRVVYALFDVKLRRRTKVRIEEREQVGMSARRVG